MTPTPSRAEAERLIKEAAAAHEAAIAAEKAVNSTILMQLRKDLKALDKGFLEAQEAYEEERESLHARISELEVKVAAGAVKPSTTPVVKSAPSIRDFLNENFEFVIKVVSGIVIICSLAYLLI